MDYEKQLSTRVERLVEGEWSVDLFRTEFYDFYVDEVPDSALTNAEAEFFDAVQEKLDWTDAAPDRVSRENGWISEQEYVE